MMQHIKHYDTVTTSNQQLSWLLSVAQMLRFLVFDLIFIDDDST